MPVSTRVKGRLIDVKVSKPTLRCLSLIRGRRKFPFNLLLRVTFRRVVVGGKRSHLDGCLVPSQPLPHLVGDASEESENLGKDAKRQTSGSRAHSRGNRAWSFK